MVCYSVLSTGETKKTYSEKEKEHGLITYKPGWTITYPISGKCTVKLRNMLDAVCVCVRVQVWMYSWDMSNLLEWF